MVCMRARGRGSRCWRVIRAGRGMRCVLASGASAELQTDECGLRSGIWRGRRELSASDTSVGAVSGCTAGAGSPGASASVDLDIDTLKTLVNAFLLYFIKYSQRNTIMELCLR